MTDNSMEAIQLSRMRAEDVPQVYALELACFTTPWSAASYYQELNNPSGHYLVAKIGDEVVGYGGMWVVLGEAHVVTLAADPAHRRQGIGRLLMNALIEEARHRAAVVIRLEVRLNNTPAQRLYESLGFTVTGRRRGYYPDTGEDALIMALEL